MPEPILTRWTCASCGLDVLITQLGYGDVLVYCLKCRLIPHIQPNASPTLLPKGEL